MKRGQEYLLKRFASVLRKLALGNEKEIKPDTNVALCLNRKDLIQILKKQFGGTISKEHNLVEMEKEELFDQPLKHWEEIRGTFQIFDGKILRFILALKYFLKRSSGINLLVVVTIKTTTREHGKRSLKSNLVKKQNKHI